MNFALQAWCLLFLMLTVATSRAHAYHRCSVLLTVGGERQAQAERLLQRSFEARHSSPSSFAFLCDELAVIVQAGQLAPALTDWLRNAATEELENFLDDRTPQIPSVQVEAGK